MAPISENASSVWYLKTTRSAYATTGSAAATVVETVRDRLNGFTGTLRSERHITDIHGNETVVRVAVDAANQRVTETTTIPSSTISLERVWINDMLSTERDAAGQQTIYGYNWVSLRLASIQYPRIGKISIGYYGAGNKSDLRAWMTDGAGNKTYYYYDDLKRLAATKNPLDQYTRYAYNSYDQVTRIWGDTQYPVEFTYDVLGRQIGMKTFRTGTAWNGETWPENAPAGDLTTWMYDQATGLVTQKIDAALKAVSYTYTVDGKLASRTWARGIVTNYGYDPATGKLLTVDYADNTPDITYTYNRLGYPASVTDAAGTRNFAYNADFDLTSESISGIYNKVISRTYTDSGAKGRPLAMSVDGVNNYTYGYDTYGRLNQIATPAGNFNYSYSDGNLIHQITRPNNVTTTFTYESDRDMVTQVANGAVSIFNYANNAIGNRTSMGRSGSAFTAPDTLSYGYNDRSEVISAHSNNNASYNYSYGFDSIGNRLTANLAGTSYSYTANLLNQYTAVNNDIPTYDFDGNMLTNGAWTYTWNGENRMISAVNGSARLEFAYDYLGRRVEKKVYDGETLSKHTKFVYNGFKLIEELDALNSNATLRKYTWQPDALGLDVPISVYDAALDTTYFYSTDANKNISELTNGTGTVVAHYEYSPFGVQTSAIGSHATINPFRFSSEYFDAETGLVYYNYRFLYPNIGKWTSLDPVTNKEEINLYCFILNNIVNDYDINGLRKGGNNGGFTIKTIPGTTAHRSGFQVTPNDKDGNCCCSDGQTGKTVFAQYLDGKVDSAPQVPRYDIKNKRRIYAYTDPSPTHPGGRTGDE